ncbi:MAG: hypothetical protein ACLQHT_18515 [Terracidiphilus sp.]
MPPKTIDQMLKTQFSAKHVTSLLRHFQLLVDDYQKQDWPDSIAKSGKFVEAVLKALWVHAGEVVPAGKDFKAGTIMDQLPSKTTLRDSLRLTVNRSCRFVYEVASNRGGRHDADEIEANEMDAAAVVANCSWILGELLRYSQKGLDLAQAKAAVESVTRRKYPFAEEIDGRVYVDIATSAREAALLILWVSYPGRVKVDALVEQVSRHGYKKANSNIAVARIKTLVDDSNGLLKLRNTGLREAERLIDTAEGKKR